MPNSFLPPVNQGTGRSKQGAILIGDSWNMRHPLTGGGMTVALNDVVILRELLGSVDDLKNWKKIQKALHRWHWDRKPLSSTVNILSVALYDLFGADGEFFYLHFRTFVRFAHTGVFQTKNFVSYGRVASSTLNEEGSASMVLYPFYPGACFSI